MVDVPLPSLQDVAVAVVFYITGMVTPYYYAQERLRGFGRAVASRLPYEPPPGRHKDAALETAVAMGKSTSVAGEEAEEETEE